MVYLPLAFRRPRFALNNYRVMYFFISGWFGCSTRDEQNEIPSIVRVGDVVPSLVCFAFDLLNIAERPEVTGGKTRCVSMSMESRAAA